MSAEGLPMNRGLALAAFATGLLIFFNVNLVGNFPVSEFVLLAIFGRVLLRTCLTQEWSGRFLNDRLFWMLLLSQAVAFLSYVVSDLYRDSSFFDIARGWSRMVFLAIDVFAIAFLYGEDTRNFLWSQFGSAIGAVVSTQFNGALFDDTWKFGYALPVTLAVFTIAPQFGLGVCAFAAAGMGVVHAMMDYRSLGGLCFLAALLIGLQTLPPRSRPQVIIPGLLLGICIAFFAYTHAGSDESRRGDRSNVERSAMITAAWTGFESSPLIGQGSWFGNSKVMDDFVAIRSESAKLAGVHGYAEDENPDTVAIHSQLLVSVAEGGLVGGTFFATFGVLVAWALIYTTIWRAPDKMTPIFLLTLLLALWNLFMSPFSGAHRVVIAMSCGVVLILWREAHGNLASSEVSNPDAIEDLTSRRSQSG